MQQLENKIKQLEDEKINKEVDKLARNGIFRKYQTGNITDVSDSKGPSSPKLSTLMERVSGNLSSHSFHTLPLDTNGQKNKS